jgi:hypothetical protein
MMHTAEEKKKRKEEKKKRRKESAGLAGTEASLSSLTSLRSWLEFDTKTRPLFALCMSECECDYKSVQHHSNGARYDRRPRAELEADRRTVSPLKVLRESLESLVVDLYVGDRVVHCTALHCTALHCPVSSCFLQTPLALS